VSGAQVFVLDSGGNLATIYEDAAGTQSKPPTR
jgi:hypothetical protein